MKFSTFLTSMLLASLACTSSQQSTPSGGSPSSELAPRHEASSSESDRGGKQQPRPAPTVTSLSEPIAADLCELARSSDMVVEVEIVSLTPTTDDDYVLPSRSITAVEALVLQSTQESPPKHITFLVDGRPTLEVMSSAGPMTPRFSVGENAVVFLFDSDNVSGPGPYLVVGRGEGKFAVGADGYVTNGHLSSDSPMSAGSFAASVIAYLASEPNCSFGGQQPYTPNPSPSDADVSAPAPSLEEDAAP